MAKAGFANGFKIEHQVGANIKTSGVSHQALAEKIQPDLAKIGITTVINVMDPIQYGDIYRGGKSTLQTRGWNPDYPDALNQLAFCPGEKVGQGRLNWKAEQAPEDRGDSASRRWSSSTRTSAPTCSRRSRP